MRIESHNIFIFFLALAYVNIAFSQTFDNTKIDGEALGLLQKGKNEPEAVNKVEYFTQAIEKGGDFFFEAYYERAKAYAVIQHYDASYQDYNYVNVNDLFQDMPTRLAYATGMADVMFELELWALCHDTYSFLWENDPDFDSYEKYVNSYFNFNSEYYVWIAELLNNLEKTAFRQNDWDIIAYGRLRLNQKVQASTAIFMATRVGLDGKRGDVFHNSVLHYCLVGEHHTRVERKSLAQENFKNALLLAKTSEKEDVRMAHRVMINLKNEKMARKLKRHLP